MAHMIRVIWYESYLVTRFKIDSDIKQENSLRNPAYDGLFPISTLQEYINGKDNFIPMKRSRTTTFIYLPSNCQ